jgi:SAM-dependent methyltransferase
MAGVSSLDRSAAPPDLGTAYSRSGVAWQRGPERIYDRLAEVLVEHAPAPLAGRLVLDVGAGTGAASRAVQRAGGTTIAVDLAVGMLAIAGSTRVPAVAADARHLPAADRSVDGVVAAFSFNHVPDPELAFREARRVTRPGGIVLASAYAADDDHPVKAAVTAAATEEGWQPADWYADLRQRNVPRLAAPDLAMDAARAGGLDRAEARVVAVGLPDLDTSDLVAWRLGMAHLAPFFDSSDVATKRRIVARARELLGDPPPLVRRMVVVSAVV